VTGADLRPRVQFAVRRPAGSGRWWYERIIIACPDGGIALPMAYPPAPGDTIMLWSTGGKIPGGSLFTVVSRMWAHSGYGSADWPYGQADPASGPVLDIIVEPGGGAYADETDICAEPSCEAVIIDGAWWFPPGSDTPDEHDHRPYQHDPVTPS